MNIDEKWMDLAITLAKATNGQTSPNPSVGAVVIKDEEVVGVGTHLRAGTEHAEVHALRQAGDRARGATIYVTLEPCNHIGRTPPCTEMILASGIKRVVIGMKDPDPRVAGSGIEKLEVHGVEVLSGILIQECFELNESYFWHRRTGRPLVTLKMATTLDGKIATSTGDSRYVTSEEARADVHLLRHQHDAILVGIGTALADDPQLTTRLPMGGKNPIRIVLDSKLRLPISSKLADTSEVATWVFTTKQKDRKREQELQERGVQVFTQDEETMDWNFVFSTLGKKEILSVLVEGGSEIHASLLRDDQAHRIIQYIAPKYLGGRGSLSAIGGENPAKMAESLWLEDLQVEKIGADLKITGWRKRGTPECLQASSKNEE